MVAYCLELQMLFLMKSFWKAKFWMRWKHKLSYKCRWLQCSLCFKALHNRANTDIYKVLQIIGKSISLELVYLKVSSSESKICKRCLRWFICSRNTNLPEELRRSWPYFAFYEMQNHWLYKSSPSLLVDYSCTFISQNALLRIHYIAREKYTLLF